MNAKADQSTSAKVHAEIHAEPLCEGWMYRSEAFAEDIDHLLSVAVAVAVVKGPFSGVRRGGLAINPAGWPAMLAGALLGRPQGAG